MSETAFLTNAMTLPRTVLVDLDIQEFDQWSNSSEWTVSPTTSCWCRADLLDELEELAA